MQQSARDAAVRRRFSTLRILLILVATLAPLAACGKRDAPTESSTDAAIQQRPAAPPPKSRLILTPAQQVRRDELAAAGSLRIVTRIRESIYEPDKYGPGRAGGMEYLRAQRLAELLELPLQVTLVHDFSDYFTINGVKLGAQEAAALLEGSPADTPDLLRNNHILFDGFSYRAWRAQLVRFVPVTPDKNVVLTRRESDIHAPEDLDGLTVAVASGSVFGTEFEELARLYGLSLNRLVVDDTPGMSRALVEGTADASGAGSIAALFEIENNPQLTIAFPFPDPPGAPAATGWSNWAVARDDAVLASIIEDYIAYIHASGYYFELWQKQFDVPFNDYLQMLNLTVE